MSKVKLVIKDHSEKFKALVRTLQTKEVLVGIPADEDARNDETTLGNAAILFINNFGSPAQNIPPRPVMDIGIKRALPSIVKEFERAALVTLDGSESKLNQSFERVGVIASQSIKATIDEQIDIDPPAQSTLIKRQAKGFQGDKALVVTGQLRNSITYVVKG